MSKSKEAALLEIDLDVHYYGTTARNRVGDILDEYAKEVSIQFLKDLINGDGALVKPNIRGRWFHGNEEDAHGRDTARELWDQIQKHKSQQIQG